MASAFYKVNYFLLLRGGEIRYGTEAALSELDACTGKGIWTRCHLVAVRQRKTQHCMTVRSRRSLQQNLANRMGAAPLQNAPATTQAACQDCMHVVDCTKLGMQDLGSDADAAPHASPLFVNLLMT